MRRLRLLVVAAALLMVPSGGSAPMDEIDNLGAIPVDCGVLGRDYADPSCLTQTRNGTFSLSPHVVHAGKTITGTISNRCKRHEKVGFDQPPDADCPIGWDGMLYLGKRVSGCGGKNPSCTVRIPERAPTQRYSIITVGITSDQGTGISKDYFAVLGSDWFLLAGHVTDEQGKPLRGVPISISGPSSERRTTDMSGAYNAVLKRGKYTVTVSRPHLKPVETKDCQVASEEATSCSVNLIQDRTADFEINAPTLIFQAKLGARVRGHKYPSMVKAGTSFLIDVTLRNTSRKNRLLVWPIYGELGGNASDGHLQKLGLPVNRNGANGSLSEVQASPWIVLQPKQTRHFNVVVRTSASDASEDDQAGAAGGTRATIAFSPPALAEIKKGAKLETLTKADLKMLDPRKAVELEDESASFSVSIDDSAPDPPPADWYLATESVTKGVVWGLYQATCGIVRGIFWDIPRLIIDANVWAVGVPLHVVAYSMELWRSVKDDPAAMQVFVDQVTSTVLNATSEVPALFEQGAALNADVNRAVYQHFNRLEKEWYAGDWRVAVEEYASGGTELVATIALPAVAARVAPGVLARLPQAAAAFQAAKAKVYTQAASKLAPLVEGRAAVRPVAFALKTTMKPAIGKTLTVGELESLYGLSANEASWLARFSKARKLLITFRSRAQSSLAWIKKGAMLKPFWIKVKTVNWHDVQYLGYKEADIGRVILKRPVSRKVFYDTVLPKIPVKERAAAAKRWLQRSQEWEHEAPKYFEWQSKGRVPDSDFPWGENLVNPNAAAGLPKLPEPPRFRLATSDGRPDGEYIVEIVNPKTGKFSSVTGDIDFLSITKANGKPLTDAEHVAVVQEISESPVGMMHPEAASWKAPKPIKDKYGQLDNGGECCPGQFGADGEARAVMYRENKSFYKDPEHYFIYWDGGYFTP